MCTCNENYISHVVFINHSLAYKGMFVSHLTESYLSFQRVNEFSERVKIRGESALNIYLIFYYPVTPQEYEPPGFKPSTCTDFQYEEEPVTINVGDVATVR